MSRGLARQLLLTITEGSQVLVLSNELQREVAKVLRHPGRLVLHRVSEERMYEFIGLLSERAEIIISNPLLNPPIRGLNDVVVMQTAILASPRSFALGTDEGFLSPPAAPTWT